MNLGKTTFNSCIFSHFVQLIVDFESHTFFQIAMVKLAVCNFFLCLSNFEISVCG